VHSLVHQSSKIASREEVTEQLKLRFLKKILLVDGSIVILIRIRTNNNGYQKLKVISDPDPEHWLPRTGTTSMKLMASVADP
jgi:hypothetical protein